jgi:molecular chaperone DnaK (HSP70)
VRDRIHVEIVPDDDNRAAVRLGENVLTLEEVRGLILKECREMAEQALGTKVSRAVVTCPAYYSEPQREAVRRAGKLAGLKVERVLNEPTAAALAFGMNRELAKSVLVYDLGGGTFDATLLKIDKNVFEVLATGGDVFLGGVDFYNHIVDVLLQRYQAQHGQVFTGDRVALSRISEVAEKAKVALSEQSSFDVHLPMLEMDPSGTPRDLKCTLTRADIEKACTELVDRTIQAVQDVLLDAKLPASKVDDVILVGGMSRMPLVREKLKAVFKKPPQASVNADEAVALGAALYSGSVDKVSSLVLIDVVPMTVGLGKPGGGFHRLIERNTPLPTTRSFGMSTQRDDQTELEVLIFQGEDSNVAGNEFLGAVKVDGLPKGPKGSVQVAITVSLDAECVLKVEVREFRTRKVVHATLATRYTSDEVARRLQISSEQRAQSDQKRSEELGQRAGSFWSRLKRVFSRG